MNLLCIDAGNTFVKWCVFDQNSLVAQSATGQHATSVFKPFDSCLRALETCLASVLEQNVVSVLLSNVLGDEFERVLRALCNARQIDLHVLSVNSGGHVMSAYDVPQTLGKDRWAVCLAVAQESRADVNLVVSFGTATTLDAVVKKDSWQHLGGFIVPGIQTMLASLHNQTAGLPQLDPASLLQASLSVWPRSTQQAISAGVGRMQIAWVQSLVDELRNKHAQAPAVWFVGGLGPQMKVLYPAAEVLEQAVFKGLLFDYQNQLKGAA